MANPLPLSDRIEEIQAEIDELINGRVDELRASAGVPRDWIKQSLFARNGGLCRCKLAIMLLSKKKRRMSKTQTAEDRPRISAQRMDEKDEISLSRKPKDPTAPKTRDVEFFP